MARGWGSEFYFFHIILFLLVRSPCKNLKPYDNPFWDFNNGARVYRVKKEKYLKWWPLYDALGLADITETLSSFKGVVAKNEILR